MSPEFNTLLASHIGTSFAKQLAFADLLGDRNWGVNISEGRATFGEDLFYPIQLIGTEADGDSTWLWAWGNEESNLPSSILRVSEELRALGQSSKIPELVEANFSLEIANGHTIAMVASGLNPDCCYYRGPYNGGALFFLVCGVPSTVTRHVAPERAITVLTEIISQFDIDNRQMAEAFLRDQGFTLEMRGSTMSAMRGGQPIDIVFDSMNRIASIQGTVSPTPSPQTPWWQF